MTLREILEGKGTGFVTIRPNASLLRVTRLFHERGISSVIVTNIGGRPLGIVTDRLIIEALATRGADARALSAADLMETPIPTADLGDRVSHAMSVMTQRRVRHLLVLDDARPIGIVSIGDLVKARLRDADLETRVLRDLAAARMSAA
ncbi:MAG: CBS domain-containing protein [Rhodothalassiaceae bacterium]